MTPALATSRIQRCAQDRARPSSAGSAGGEPAIKVPAGREQRREIPARDRAARADGPERLGSPPIEAALPLLERVRNGARLARGRFWKASSAGRTLPRAILQPPPALRRRVAVASSSAARARPAPRRAARPGARLGQLAQEVGAVRRPGRPARPCARPRCRVAAPRGPRTPDPRSPAAAASRDASGRDGSGSARSAPAAPRSPRPRGPPPSSRRRGGQGGRSPATASAASKLATAPAASRAASGRSRARPRG